MSEKQRKKDLGGVLRKCVSRLMMRRYDGEDGTRKTGAELQTEALFARALKDTRSFEILRGMLGDRDGAGDIPGEVREEVRRLTRQAFPDETDATDEMKEAGDGAP